MGSAVGCRIRYGPSSLAYPIGCAMLNMARFGSFFFPVAVELDSDARLSSCNAPEVNYDDDYGGMIS